MITWATITGGLLGSAVASIVTALVALLIFRRTRGADQDREDRRDAGLADERRRRDIAEVISILDGIETELRAAPFMGGRAVSRSLRASMLFYLNERPHHQEVADWVLERNNGFQKVMADWRRLWWLPIIRDRRRETAVQHMARTLGTLVQWAHDHIDDVWFEDMHRPALGEPRA